MGMQPQPAKRRPGILAVTQGLHGDLITLVCTTVVVLQLRPLGTDGVQEIGISQKCLVAALKTGVRLGLFQLGVGHSQLVAISHYHFVSISGGGDFFIDALRILPKPHHGGLDRGHRDAVASCR